MHRICSAARWIANGVSAAPSSWFARCRLLGDRRGVAVALFAVTGIGVIGMVGLGTEAGLWYLTRRNAQNAADSAAYAGAVRLSLAQSTLGLGLSGGQTQARDAATDTASQNGFSAGTANGMVTSVTVNTPPVSPSAYAGNAGTVQVIVQRRLPRMISGFFITSDPVITVSATASLFSQVSICILALSGGISLSGTSSIDATDCSVASNSSMAMTGSANVSAASILTVGNCTGCNASRVGSSKVSTNQPAIADPYAYLQSNTYPTSCPSGAAAPPTKSATISNKTGTLYWCSDVSIAGTVNVAPGTYILYDANLSIGSTGSLTCSACSSGGAGVTFIFTGSTPSTVGALTVSGNGSVVQLNAPLTGTYAGIVFYRDAMAADKTTSLAGGTSTDIVGGLYFPTSTISITGGAGLASSTACKAVVAKAINLIGGADVGSTGQCGMVGTPIASGQVARLVE